MPIEIPNPSSPPSRVANSSNWLRYFHSRVSLTALQEYYESQREQQQESTAKRADDSDIARALFGLERLSRAESIEDDTSDDDDDEKDLVLVSIDDVLDPHADNNWTIV